MKYVLSFIFLGHFIPKYGRQENWILHCIFQAKFEHHLSKEEVADGLKRGTLIEVCITAPTCI